MSSSPPPARGSLLVIALAVASLLLAGGCTFAPGPPQVDRGSLPRVDVTLKLRQAAPLVRFALRVPSMPADWIAQSSDVLTLGPAGPSPVPAGAPGAGGPPRAVRVGWVTPENEFVRLVQSDADEAALVVSEDGDPTATGAVPAGGRTWTTHTGRRGEAVWVADVDGVRLLITGSAPPERFTQLATTTLAAPFVR